ncbi:MAG: PD-(D/E)XK nuclease family protein, partial [Geminicoccaceae bacterium]
LLYVAVTRARDRLYLSSALKDGVVVPGRGSLADVLPDSLKQLFGRAAGTFDDFATLAWTGPSGRQFDWRLCRHGGQVLHPDEDLQGRPDPTMDFAALGPGSSRVRTSVTRWLADDMDDEPAPPGAPPADALVGTLIHRLLQFGGRLDNSASPADALAFARQLLRPEEHALLADSDIAFLAALEGWRRLLDRADVDALLRSGDVLHEVPFSMVIDEPLVRGDSGAPIGDFGAPRSLPRRSSSLDARDERRRAERRAPATLRGTIDCLIQRPDGSVMVVEFKTGRPRPSHERQLGIYVAAARACFPDSAIDGRLIYL